MRNSNLIRSILFIAVISTGCSKGGSSDSSAKHSALSVVYRNGSSSGLNKVSALEANVPLVFGGGDKVIGYNYRPGQAVQSDNGALYADWSVWAILDDTGGPFKILPGESIDVVARAGRQLDEFWNANPNFVNQVGAFRLDVIQVQSGNVGIINSANDVCGFQGAGDALIAVYEALGVHLNECAAGWLTTSYDNTPIGDDSVLFVRNDWFPSSVQVYVGDSTGANIYVSGGIGFSTDVVLNAFQQEIIGSLCQHISGTLSIIPQTGDPQTFQLVADKTVTDPTMSTNGNAVPAQLTHLAQSLVITMGLNIVPSMIQNYSQIDAAYPGPMIPLLIDRDANGVPWGLSTSFTTVTPGVLPQ